MRQETDFTRLRWNKSSHSEGGGAQCVEVSYLPAAVFVRDSKDPASVLTFSAVAWAAFVERPLGD
ncbi:hypothetical protein B0293_06060 [Amycolatopsis azurea DSM 43854]|uniref:DUF397 domain-containing protein n=1 Tax=Amycolatopsis azurea DSM 43854 TaxID=1238180 RepID=A0ABX3JJY9_9PSEU|nr:hypothetical protein B0293_06060 [Amycolatopsis azurea DSM 43854]